MDNDADLPSIAGLVSIAFILLSCLAMSLRVISDSSETVGAATWTKFR